MINVIITIFIWIYGIMYLGINHYKQQIIIIIIENSKNVSIHCI